MLESQLSRYGALSKVLPNVLGPQGKVFFVGQTTDAWFGDFQKTFPNDKDGVVRVYSTIQSAINACVGGRGDVVLIANPTMAAGATDPTSYAETLTIAASQSGISLIGIPTNRTQGGLPQIKMGSGTTALLTVRAPGCYIANLGFNGVNSSTGNPLLVGILLDDDASTKSAFGTMIENCHFKNCAGSNVLSAATGGAITWSAQGNAWQVLIRNCRFYKNVCDICLLGTAGSVPQDVVIENNIFSGPAATVDAQLYLAGGSGMNGVIIRDNIFPAFPALASGAVLRFMNLTGCVGIMSGNSFATSTTLTFGATGTGAIVPTTVFMPKNYRETTTGVSSEVFRT